MRKPARPPEYDAVRHILAAPSIAPRTAPHVRPDGFDWEGIVRAAETMSGGERLLVDIAQELWFAEKLTGLWEIPRRLGPSNSERVFTALRLCRADGILLGPLAA